MKQKIVFVILLFCVYLPLNAGDLNRDRLKQLIEEAESGDRFSQKSLAMLYLDGKFQVEKDLQKAIYWLKKSAENENPKAMIELAYIYIQEFHDFKTAHIYIKQAVDYGDPDAYDLMGSLYAGGHEVEQSFVHAYKWIYLAERHWAQRRNKYRVMSPIHREIGQKLKKLSEMLTDAQIDQAKKLAEDWQPSKIPDYSEANRDLEELEKEMGF